MIYDLGDGIERHQSQLKFILGDRCERSWIEKIAAEASDAGSNIITPGMWKKYENEMARSSDVTGIVFGIVCGSIILILTLIVLGPWIKGCLCPTFSLRKCYRKAREVKIDKVSFFYSNQI